MLAAPVAWLFQLQVTYLFVLYACSTGQHFTLHLVSILTLVIAAGGGFVAWRNWQQAGREWPNQDEGVIPRSRFMAVLGVLTSALFFLLILASWIPSFFLGPCQR